jgi:hypothetical protein
MLLKSVPTLVTHPYGDSARSALHRPAIQVGASRLDWQPTRDKSLCRPVSGLARRILNRIHAFLRARCANSPRTTEHRARFWKVRARWFPAVRDPFRTFEQCPTWISCAIWTSSRRAREPALSTSPVSQLSRGSYERYCLMLGRLSIDRPIDKFWRTMFMRQPIDSPDRVPNGTVRGFMNPAI